MNAAVGQKYRTKDRKDCVAQHVFEVTALLENHQFGMIEGIQPGVVVSIGRGHTAMISQGQLEKKFELVPTT